jgi:hypothetical protein
MPRPAPWSCTVCGATLAKKDVRNVRVNSLMIHDACDQCLRGLSSVGHKIEDVKWQGEGENFGPVFTERQPELLITEGDRPLNMDVKGEFYGA